MRFASDMPNDWSNKMRIISPQDQVQAQQQMRNIESTWWFSPLTPVAPSTPSKFLPRQYGTLPGQNIIWQPRAQDAISYETLRALADTWDLLRMVIETKKDQLCAVEYELRVRQQPGESNEQRKKRSGSDKLLQQLAQFYDKPDGIHPFKRWLRMWLEDSLVIDAVALWHQRDRSGKVANIFPLAGDTINRMVTEQGITPTPASNWKRLDDGTIEPRSSCAYQEVLYGTVAYEFTTEDMLFSMRNERTWKQYGYSRVEQALLTISLGLRRMDSQIQWYTSGNTPEAMVFLPPSLNIDQVKEIQDWFDTVNAGDMAQRRRIRFMPGAGEGDNARPNVVFPKEAVLKDELDVWLAQCICYDFGVSAQPFMKMMNRASAEEANENAEESGLAPDIDYVLEVLNQSLGLLEVGDQYEWAAKTHQEVDVLKSAQASNLLVGKVMTINEDREARGLDRLDIPEADVPGVFSPMNGFIPIEGSIDATEQMRASQLLSNQTRSDVSEQPDDGKAQPDKKKPVNTKPKAKDGKPKSVDKAFGGYSRFGSLKK